LAGQLEIVAVDGIGASLDIDEPLSVTAKLADDVGPIVAPNPDAGVRDGVRT